MSDKTQVSIEKGNVVVTQQFNLGKPIVEKEGENTISLAPHVGNLANYFKAMILDRANTMQERELLETQIDEYFKLRLLDVLGVQYHPLKQLPDGSLEGFSGEYAQRGFEEWTVTVVGRGNPNVSEGDQYMMEFDSREEMIESLVALQEAGQDMTYVNIFEPFNALSVGEFISVKGGE